MRLSGSARARPLRQWPLRGRQADPAAAGDTPLRSSGALPWGVALCHLPTTPTPRSQVRPLPSALDAGFFFPATHPWVGRGVRSVRHLKLGAALSPQRAPLAAAQHRRRALLWELLSGSLPGGAALPYPTGGAPTDVLPLTHAYGGLRYTPAGGPVRPALAPRPSQLAVGLSARLNPPRPPRTPLRPLAALRARPAARKLYKAPSRGGKAAPAAWAGSAHPAPFAYAGWLPPRGGGASPLSSGSWATPDGAPLLGRRPHPESGPTPPTKGRRGWARDGLRPVPQTRYRPGLSHAWRLLRLQFCLAWGFPWIRQRRLTNYIAQLEGVTGLGFMRLCLGGVGAILRGCGLLGQQPLFAEWAFINGRRIVIPFYQLYKGDRVSVTRPPAPRGRRDLELLQYFQTSPLQAWEVDGLTRSLSLYEDPSRAPLPAQSRLRPFPFLTFRMYNWKYRH